MGESKEYVYSQIAALATKLQRKEPSVTFETAVAKVLETNEGRQLQDRYRSADDLSMSDEVTPASEPVAGGANGELLAARIEKMVTERASSEGISRYDAYSEVLASPEGQVLRKRYDQLVR